MNETHEPKKCLKVETALLIFLILASITTIAVLIFGGWPSEFPESFYNRLRIEKLIELRNQIIKTRLEAMTTITTIWGVIAILFNVYYTARRADFLEKDTLTELENVTQDKTTIKTNDQDLELLWEGAHFKEHGKNTEQFLTAIEQLGSDHLPIRLGGIYALEKIAKNSLTDHLTIVEVLTAFVRENAPFNPPLEIGNEAPQLDIDTDMPKAEDTEQLRKLPFDIQAALTVLGRRDANKDPKNYRLDLDNTDIGGALLSSANLPGVSLKGCNLQRADLLQANLQGAFLSSANLQGAFLMGANLQGTVLRRANLQGAFLVGANLLGADFSGANLQGAFLMGASLLGANLKGASLLGADLSEAEHLESAQIESAQTDTTTTLPYNAKAP